MPTPMPATGSFHLVEAVTERFDGAPVAERRRWSDEFKAQAVAAALEPGVNVSALARRLGLSPPLLFGWRKAFLTSKNEAAAVASPSPVIEIVVREVTIRVCPDVSEADHHAQKQSLRWIGRRWPLMGHHRHPPADLQIEQRRPRRVAHPDPRAPRQPMAERRHRRAHALEL